MGVVEHATDAHIRDLVVGVGRTSHPEFVADDPEQWRLRFDVYSVHRECNHGALSLHPPLARNSLVAGLYAKKSSTTGQRLHFTDACAKRIFMPF
jgi:hypothetical protein